MPSFTIDLNRLSGIFRKIADYCDIGDEQGKLVSAGNINEVSIFLKAADDYKKSKSFNINGQQYWVSEKSGQIFDSFDKMLFDDKNTQPADKTRVYNPIQELEQRTTGTNNIDWKGIIQDNYNAKAGKKFSDIAYQNRNKTPIIRNGKKTFFLSLCKQYVREDIEKMYPGCTLGGAHAWEAIALLRGGDPELSKHFIEIPVGSIDTKDLPDGAILCFDKDDATIEWNKKHPKNKKRGPKGYSAESGHIEIVTHINGNTVAVSDGVTNNIRTPDAIFIPA